MIAALVVLLVAISLVYYLQRPELSDEEQIQRLFLEAERAVEAKDASDIMRLIADDYDDGTFVKRDLTRLAIRAFRTSDEIDVVPYLRLLQVQGQEAHAELDVDLLVDSDTQRLKLAVDLKKTGRGWQVIRASGWEVAGSEFE